jgi:hypothetical protein
VFLDGRFGTKAEQFNALTSRKLLLRRPAPMFIIGSNNETETAQRYLQLLADQKASPGSPSSWVLNTVRYGENLDVAREGIRTYRADMPAYWDKADVPPQHVAKYYKKRVETLDRIGMSVPQSEQDAVRAYAGDLIDE